MLKLLSLFLLTVLRLAASIDIKCEYISFYQHPTNGYNCKVTGQVTTNERNMTLTSASGRHSISGFSNQNVERIFYFETPNMKFIPSGYTKLFPNLVNMWIAVAPIENISKSDFEVDSKIEIFAMRGTKLACLEADIFVNLARLEEVYLYANKINYIDENAFRASPKLSTVHLYDNSIEYLPSIFKHNPLMAEFDIRNNKLKVIEADVLSGLRNLRKIDMRMNLCVSLNSPPSLLSALNEKIRESCKNPFDDQFKTLKAEKQRLIDFTTVLRASFDEQDEKLEEATEEKMRLKEDLRKITVKYTDDTEKLKIAITGMKKELDILATNHSDVKDQLDALFKENNELKLNITMNQRFSDMHDKAIEELNEQIKKAQETEAEMKKNLTALHHENHQVKTNLSSLQELYENILIDHNELELDFDNVTLENEELRSSLGNMSIKEAQLSDDMYELASSEKIFKVFTVIFVIVLALVLGKVIFNYASLRRTREKVSTGYEFSFSNGQ